MHGSRGFFNGVGAFRRGAACVRQNAHALLPYFIVPVVVNLALYAIVIWFSWAKFDDWHAATFTEDMHWSLRYLGVQYLSWLLYVVLVAVLVLFTFVPVGCVVMAPFNELLSQKVEAIVHPRAPSAGGGVRGFVADLWMTVLHAALRLAILIVLLLICSPLYFFVPPVAPVVMGYISMRYLAWDGMDYCMARQRMTFGDKSRFLKQHRADTLGLGAAAFALLLVPLLALVVLPLLAVSGTVLFWEIKQRPAEIIVEDEASA